MQSRQGSARQHQIMEETMKGLGKVLRIITTVFLVGALGACAAGPSGPYYRVQENPAPVAAESQLNVGANDQYYTMRIDDRTPFGLQHLPQAADVLYGKGYDEVRRQNRADFTIDIAFFADYQDNPERRAGQTVGGALAGAATGAIIGGALGHPGRGAAIGAASGGALGLVAPASTPLVRIDIRIYSLNDRSSSQRSATVDLSNVPPYDVQRVIDMQVSRMLQSLPGR
jgi:hypothetical protein